MARLNMSRRADNWFTRMFTPPGRDEYYEGAYEEKKPMSEWYNWLLGPTGYDKGISWSSFNPVGTTASGFFNPKTKWPKDILTNKALYDAIDWRKTAQGGTYGMKLGGKLGSFSGGYGTLLGGLIGGGIGGGLGSVFTEGPGGGQGMGPAAAGKSDEDSYYAGWQPWFKGVQTGSNILGVGQSLGNLSMGTGKWKDIGNVFGFLAEVLKNQKGNSK